MHHRGAKEILFKDQMGSFQRKSGLERVEYAGSYGKRRKKKSSFSSTLPMIPREPSFLLFDKINLIK